MKNNKITRDELNAFLNEIGECDFTPEVLETIEVSAELPSGGGSHCSVGS